jgi:hypothetical protein
MGKMRNAYKIFVGKPGGNKPLRRPKRIWEDNIIKDLKEIRQECVWTGRI